MLVCTACSGALMDAAATSLLEVRLIGVGAEETQFIHGCKLQYGMNIIQMKWDVTGTISTRIF